MTYVVKRPWQWVNTTLTTYPANPIKFYTAGDLGTARDYSVPVRTGRYDLSTGSVDVVKAPANLTTGGTYSEQFTNPTSGVYTVYFAHDLQFGLPSFPWDARHDVAEFTLTVVVATTSGGTWDAIYTPHNFVLDIDVGDVLERVVGRTLEHYLASNQVVAIWRCVGLLKSIGIIRVGFHWDWTWDSSWSKSIEYVVTAMGTVSTYARSLQFKPDAGSSETLVYGGELALWDSSSQPEP